MEKMDVANMVNISNFFMDIAVNATKSFSKIPMIEDLRNLYDVYNNSIQYSGLIEFHKFFTFIMYTHLKKSSELLYTSSNIIYSTGIDSYIKIEIFEEYVRQLCYGYMKKYLSFNELQMTFNEIANHINTEDYFKKVNIVMKSHLVESLIRGMYYAYNDDPNIDSCTINTMLHNIAKLIVNPAKESLIEDKSEYIKIFKETLNDDILEELNLSQYVNNDSFCTSEDNSNDAPIKESDNDIPIEIDNLIAPEDGIIVNNYNNNRILMVKFDNPTLLGDSEYKDSQGQDAVTRYMINYNSRAELLDDFSLFIIDKKIPFEFENGHRFKKGDILIEKSIRRITKEDLAIINSALHPDKFYFDNKES